tara:strand:+ start:364 stop:540 length:177 start_codon:yes stop_codon:yes gene_type:complete
MRDLVTGMAAVGVVIVGIFFLAAVMQRSQYQPPSIGPYLPDCALGISSADPRACDPQR